MKNTDLDTISSPERNILDLRRVGFNEVLVIGKYTYNQTQKQLPFHRHEGMLEICFCSKGEQVYEVAGETYRIKGGELFVTYPGEWHGTGSHPEEKGELYWIIIHLDTTTKRFFQYDGEAAEEWFQQLLNLPREFTGGIGLKQHFEKIFRLYTEGGNRFAQIKLQHQVCECLLQIVQASQRPVILSSSERLQRLNEYIEHHKEKAITVLDLAKLVNLSASHFKAWFKQETGTTPLDYMLRKKIKAAQSLLAQENLSVTAIAFELGFPTSQYFASVFKKFTGQSPSEYKRSLSTEESHSAVST